MAPRKTSPMPQIKDEEEAPKYPLTITIHTISREEFKIDMGTVNDEEMNTVRNIVNSGFVTLKTSKSWGLTDTRGVEYAFNSDHIVCIEMRLAVH